MENHENTEGSLLTQQHASLETNLPDEKNNIYFKQIFVQEQDEYEQQQQQNQQRGHQQFNHYERGQRKFPNSQITHVKSHLSENQGLNQDHSLDQRNNIQGHQQKKMPMKRCLSSNLLFSQHSNSQVRQRQRKHRIRDTKQLNLKKSQIHENIAKIEREKSQSDLYFIENVLEHHFLFRRCEQSVRAKLAHQFFYCKGLGGKVFKEGDPPSLFFIIEKGSLEKIFLGSVRETLHVEDTFGDYDILRESPRTATLQQTEECYFWALDKQTYKEHLDHIFADEIKSNKKTIEGHEFFDIMTDEQKDEILHVTFSKIFKIGQTISDINELATSCYIIQEGTVVVLDENSQEIRKLGQNDEIGFKYFKKCQNYQEKYVAYTSRVMCLKVDKKSIERYIGEDLINFYFKNVQRHSCEQNHTLRKLDPLQIERLVRCSKQVHYQSGHVLLKKGHIAHKIYFILDGKAQMVYDETNQQPDIFENGSVIFDIKKPAPGDFIVSSNDCVIAEITAQQFLHQFGDQYVLGECIIVPNNPFLKTQHKQMSQDFLNVCEYVPKSQFLDSSSSLLGKSLLKRVDSFEIRSSTSQENLRNQLDKSNNSVMSTINEKNLQYSNHSLSQILEPISQVNIKNFKTEDFVFIKQVGKGYFGVINLCYCKKDGQVYALKTIQKADIIEKHMEIQVIEEKSILEKLDHPFIMNYYGAFLHSHNVCLVLQYIRGIELFDVIRLQGVFQPEDMLYYAASLVNILEYLYTQEIVYRDLKPENIMINEAGEVRLIDLGASTKLTEKGGRTFTITGTPHYMAPEITDQKGYSYYVDLWSLGIVLYECLCGPTPFGTNDLEDPFEIYQAIKNNQLTFPDFVTNQEIKDFISQLLNKKPFKRVGGSWATLKQHPYFDIRGKLDWSQLQQGCGYKPPFQPECPIEVEEIEQAIKNNVNLSEKLEKQEYDNNQCKYNKDWETQFLLDPDTVEDDQKSD